MEEAGIKNHHLIPSRLFCFTLQKYMFNYRALQHI